jgi:uncharacterized protein (TIGR02996 family)
MGTAPGEFLTYCADSALDGAMGMLVAFRYEDGEDDEEHYPIIPKVGKAMDAEAGFIESIRERSDDRSRWLVFADWLEERGDPRGELIRLQVHLAELPADDLGWQALVAREFELFHAIPRETMVLYPPRVVQILMSADTPIEEACSILVGGMAAAVEAVARAFRQLDMRTWTNERLHHGH